MFLVSLSHQFCEGCSSLIFLFLDKFNAVAIWIFYEGNNRCSVLHWAWFASDGNAIFAEFITNSINICNTEGEVTKAIAEVKQAVLRGRP